MKELKIYEFQAKRILDTLKLIARVYECNKKETCLDRDIMQSIGYIENVIKEDINANVKRY